MVYDVVISSMVIYIYNHFDLIQLCVYPPNNIFDKIYFFFKKIVNVLNFKFYKFF